MRLIHLLGLIAGLALLGTGYAQDDKHRKKSTATIAPTPYTPKATPPAPPPTPQRPKSNHSERSSEYTREPYRPRTERDYEPWRTNRASPPAKSTSSARPKTQAVKNTTTQKPEPRDPALARCDKYQQRMEQVIREEQRGGDPARMQRLAEERKQVYQETMRAGC